MLRSKQLLPLYKGARSWLAAGSLSKNSPPDGNNNSAISGTDDSKSENGFDSHGLTKSQLRNINTSKCSEKPPSKLKDELTPSKKLEAFSQESKAPTSEYSLHGRRSAGKVGLASLGSISACEDTIQHGSLSRSLGDLCSPSSPTRLENVRALSPLYSQPPVASQKGPQCEVNNTRISGVLQVTPASDSHVIAGPGSLRAATSLKQVSHQATQGQVIQFGSLETPVVVSRDAVIDIPYVQHPPIRHANEPIPVLQPEFGHGHLKKRDMRLQKNNDTLARGQRRNLSTAQSSWTSDSSIELGSQRRSKTADNHQDHRSMSVTGFELTSGEIIGQVSSILRRSRWGPETVLALQPFSSRLTAYHINEVLKHQRDPELAWNLFDWAKRQNGFKHDVCTYTTMIGILGRARNFEACNLLLEAMRIEGCEPSVVTYNRLIHSYGRANNLHAGLKLFHQMQDVGCRPDRVTYCTLIDLHSKAGLNAIAMDMCEKMWQAGFQHDTYSYSVIIHCVGKAGNLSGAYQLFRDMIQQGHAPNLVTYNIVIDLHADAGKYHMALKLYNDMQDAGFRPDKVTYCSIVKVLGHCGHLDEAEDVLVEMEQAGWTADLPIYGQMVDLWGKAGNAEKSHEWYQKMLEAGFSPNVVACNSLLAAYLRANEYKEARHVFDSMSEWGLVPTLQTYTLLLSCCTTCNYHHAVNSVQELMNRTGHPAHNFVCMLLNETDIQDTRSQVWHFFNSLQVEDQDCKRGFADALIEYLHKLDMKSKAGYVWEVAMEHNLYPLAVNERTPNCWTVNLHVMSMGTALVALLRTLASFRERMLTTGIVPDKIEIVTGWGRRSRVSGSSLVKLAVQNTLAALGSPFYVNKVNAGCFVGSGKPLSDWLHQPHMEHMLTL